ncbi:serine/threonine-specific protein kinase NAK, variant [Capsaspora owczarzaki ATCC 30864]|uniref:non-specific serine/threonine protein kinase n=1 Tax=Capsaspora owczarzaki (strain ATCC 30864) TaxID=595528 RepID=E9CBQ0_CAPO3|nr:serine/threonine-specific protein kinase NAK [Capsaspora owczarzaki ATCC 30864]XP_011270538.1 serine/threonine-specific protein kinase NAK, variant [Capsaspora owczarzaki ATCC 30864]KJE95170.1 TKL/IRAK protein kinase [Capsaspora owczarzaki ATCC 30864]|eukprot:XP_004346322.2 serine/threonine-specific protein kinase NAK [Capsaspora owczarzaki ATCC 30864]
MSLSYEAMTPEQRELYEKVKNASGELSFRYHHIGDVEAQAIAEALKVNTTLTQLTLQRNQIGDVGAQAIAEALKMNTTLTQFDLHNIEIGEVGAQAIAEALKVNTALIQLDLSWNSVGDAGALSISEALRQNKSLQNLRLESNQIGAAGALSISEALQKNTTLQNLNLAYNQIGHVEEMVLRHSIHPTLRLGIADGYVRQAFSNMFSIANSTDGIDISTVILREKDESMILIIWDFAGQEVYLVSHQFFLRERTVYLVLFDVREDLSLNSRLAFWLRSLHACVPNADIILVGTHIDDPSYASERQQEQKQNLANLLSTLKKSSVSFNVRSTVYINARNSTGAPSMPELKNALFQAGQKMPFYTQLVDGRYLQFRDLLRKRADQLVAQNKPPLCRWHEIVELGQSLRLSGRAIDAFMELLRFQGWVVFHRLADSATQDTLNVPALQPATLLASLDDIVILNPQWFTKTVLTGVITQKPKDRWVKDGIVTRKNLLRNAWKGIDSAICDQFVLLLQRYELLYKMSDADLLGTDSASSAGTCYVIPSYLPAYEFDSSRWSSNPAAGEHEVAIVMETKFLLEGFFSRLLVRFHERKFNLMAWKDAVLVNYGGPRALLRVHRNASNVRLEFTVRGQHPEELLPTLIEILDKLSSDWYPGISWETYLRCPMQVPHDKPCRWLLRPQVRDAVIDKMKNLSCSHTLATFRKEEWLPVLSSLLQRRLNAVSQPTPEDIKALQELERQPPSSELERAATEAASPAAPLVASEQRPLLAPALQPIIDGQTQHRDFANPSTQQSGISTTIPRVGMQELSQATGNFAESRRIGGGGFGSVYSGTWGGAHVAVKRLAANSMQGVAQFKAELESLSRFRHCNIVTIMCYALEGNNYCLVCELMANGSVRDRLDCTNGTPALTWPQRQRIATEIASAMNFVQTAIPRQPLFHLDLKTDNVLLDAEFHAKVADFGLTRSRGQISIKTDVYSYGMILLELLTGKQPGSALVSSVKRALKQQGRLDSELDASIVWGAPDKLAATSFAHLAIACLKPDRVDRPTFGEMLTTTGQYVDQGNAHAHAAMPHNPRMEHHDSSIKEQSQPNLNSDLASSRMEPQLDSCSGSKMSSNSDRECMLCYNAPTTAKLMPCCHACVCVACAQEMIRRQDKCMVCRVIPTAFVPGSFNQTFVP